MARRRNAVDQLFPLGVAAGPAFCNRDAERKALKATILSGTHAWIMGTRRYGKTSLVTQVAHELGKKRQPKVQIEQIDLFTVHNVAALDALLRDAVGRLSARFLPKNRRVLGKLQQVFNAFKPELTLSDDGLSVKLFSGNPSTQSIQRLLEALDEAAQHYGHRAVLVLDEFQQLTQIDTKHTLEGTIRHVAQSAKALSFVFLGSEKTLLSQMFENEKRPLYRLCRKLELARISSADYEAFLRQAAKLGWNKPVSQRAIDAILDMTDRHPYYVNALCRELWRCSTPPTASVVMAEWTALLRRERYHAVQSTMALATAQRAVLKALAIAPTASPTAQRYLGQFGIAGSTMVQSIDVLMEKDFIRRTENGVYEIVDPLVKGCLTGA